MTNKPVKCGCGADLSPTGGEGAYRHELNECFLTGAIIPAFRIRAWNALMDDTPAMLRAAEAVKKKCYEEVHRHFGDGTELNRISDIDTAALVEGLKK